MRIACRSSSREVSDELALRQARRNRRENKGSKNSHRANAVTSVDFTEEATQASMKSFWSSMGEEERNRFLSISLRDATIEMSDPSASREQRNQCKRFEKHVLDLIELSKEAQHAAMPVETHTNELLGMDSDSLGIDARIADFEADGGTRTINQLGPAAHLEDGELIQPAELTALEAEQLNEEASLREEHHMRWEMSAQEHQKIEVRKHFEVFKQYNMSHRHIFTLQQFIEEQETARACLDWACSILCDQHQILESSGCSGCDILPEDEALITLAGYGEPESEISWSQFIGLAVNGLPCSSEANRTRRQLESQLRTSDNMLCELENKLSILQRRARTFDNMVFGLREYHRCVGSELPDEMPAMHVYQAAFSCALQSVQTRVNYENRKRMVVDQRRNLQEQRAKIQEKVQDQPQSGEGDGDKFSALLSERAATITGELEHLTEQISELETYSTKAFDLQRNCRRLMDGVTRKVTEDSDGRSKGLHAFGMDESERERWCTPRPLDGEELQLFMYDGCSLQDCFQHAEYTADLLHAAMDKCYAILDDTTRTMNTMKKRVLMQEDAFVAGSEVAAQSLKAQFQAAYQENQMELKKADQAREEQAQKEELEQQAQRAKELAEDLMMEDAKSTQPKQKEKKEKPSKKKKGSADDDKKRKQEEKEKRKQDQEAQAAQVAAEQRQLALEEAKKVKMLQDEEYEQMLQQEQRRLQAISEEQKRAEEAKKIEEAKQAEEARKVEEAKRLKEAKEAQAKAPKPAEKAQVAYTIDHDVGRVELQPGQWSCGACTFVNEEADEACTVCGGSCQTPMSASVGSDISMPMPQVTEEEWVSVGNTKTDRKKQNVTDQDLQQALGQLVTEQLASVEMVGEMATHLSNAEPWLAKDIVTELANQLRSGLAADQRHAVFMQLLDTAGVTGRKAGGQQAAETETNNTPAELERVPSTPSRKLSEERATMGLSNEVGERNCFLNVVIQSLWHLHNFRQKFLVTCEEFMSKDPAKASGEGGEKEAVLSALYNVFKAYNNALGDEEQQGTAVQANSLREALSRVDNDRFQMGLMDDAAEAHEAVLECLRSSWAASLTESVFSLELVDHSQVAPGSHYKSFVHYIAAAAIRDYVTNARDVSTKRRFHTVLKHVLQDQYGTCPTPSSSDNAAQEQPKPEEPPPQPVTNNSGGKRQRKPQQPEKQAPLELKNYPEVFTLGISWESGNESQDNIKKVVDSMDEVLHLGTVFSHVSVKKNSSRNASAEKKCRMRGMICYYGRHFCAFVREGDTDEWLVLDDTMVKSVGVFEDVVAKCHRGALQPCLVFYEAVRSQPKGGGRGKGGGGQNAAAKGAAAEAESSGV